MLICCATEMAVGLPAPPALFFLIPVQQYELKIIHILGCLLNRIKPFTSIIISVYS